jgi:hypothetical protein
LYSCRNEAKQIVAIDVATGKEEIIASGAQSNDIAVSSNGEIYFTEPAEGKVWFVDKNRKMRAVVTEGIERPNGVLLSPDQSLLTVADSATKWVWSFQVQTDGSLANGQPFYRLEMPAESNRSSADGMTITEDGHLFVATALGIQICDQPGRVIGILSKPQPGPLSNAVFAGPDLQTLYVTAGDKLFRRHMRVKGVLPGSSSPRPCRGSNHRRAVLAVHATEASGLDDGCILELEKTRRRAGNMLSRLSRLLALVRAPPLRPSQRARFSAAEMSQNVA